MSDSADENTSKESERYHTTAVEQEQYCGGEGREREREREREKERERERERE